jgi:hypothetical protein
MPSRSLAILAALVTFTLVVQPPAASANPEKVFAGQIITSDKKFPMRAKSPSAFVTAIRRQKKNQFWEDKAKGTWKVYFAAFFRRPLNDIEVIVKLYDNGQVGRPMVASFEQYVSERGQRALLSDFVLERKHVGVNRDLSIVLEVGGAVVASGRFKILGEAERYSGKVDFSEEETDDE